ncbi:GGDEF domain-containing protein [Thermodesulfobacterium hydrogeniphilum]|uniref:GGDEF domain-containing protein n=1 Tax=Thermodesulfobacterium hydrogeniphilum TaxID=161156 RepID=UPI00068B231F|nr:diguanylate cyclase [Thermodesulfobacterium hydrogeniphilum]
MINKKVIYLILKKNRFFKHWRDFLNEKLGSKYNFKFFYKAEDFITNFLFHPPSMVIYYYPKDPSTFEKLCMVKRDFNLRIIPLIVIIDDLDFKFLLSKADVVDDFITTMESVEEFILRIEYAFKRLERISDNNPLTGLPGNVSIGKAIEKVLNDPNPHAVAYVDLDNFKTYNDLYGFFKGDEMIRNLARIIFNTVSELSPEDHFVGHIGGDDFVFIVPLEKVKKISQEIIDRFNKTLSYFIKPEHLEKGYFIAKDRKGQICKISLPSVSIAIVPVYKGKFVHIGEVASRAAEIKNITKKLKGSNYFIDRRS